MTVSSGLQVLFKVCKGPMYMVYSKLCGENVNCTSFALGCAKQRAQRAVLQQKQECTQRPEESKAILAMQTRAVEGQGAQQIIIERQVGVPTNPHLPRQKANLSID
ncbi:MAG TPA: hypothetical protein DDY17_05075 [Syntrophaceae bacterium]|nr:hypothetical protein [Syntrophaceae bacterium]